MRLGGLKLKALDYCVILWPDAYNQSLNSYKWQPKSLRARPPMFFPFPSEGTAASWLRSNFKAIRIQVQISGLPFIRFMGLLRCKGPEAYKALLFLANSKWLLTIGS